MSATITVQASVNAPIEKVWAYWNQPQHIMQWNHASDDWHCPNASNDVRRGGNFSYTMAAKDGSFSFDFAGVYEDVLINELIMYRLADGRAVKISFASNGDITEVVETFEGETQHTPELQQAGWQAILNNFKNYTEKL